MLKLVKTESNKAGSEHVLEGIDGHGKSVYTDEAWAPSEVLYEPPLLKVTQPKGSFCTIDARFAVSLDPDGVYDIIIDPNNRHVFKNIKEVTYRKVLEDDGNRQLVEVEQLGRWKFLFLSGSFASRVIVEQNRQEHALVFDLAKQGMMRKFSGSWKFEPMKASESGDLGHGERRAPGHDDPVVGSWVSFQQVVEPAVKPPWPLNNYIRGIAEKIVREMLGDLQRECQRLSDVQNNTTSASENVAQQS